MKINKLLGLFLVIVLITGCSQATKVSNSGEQLGDSPPQPIITFENKVIKVYQNSYCWNSPSKGTGTCADYASASEALQDKDKDLVKSGGRITIQFNVKKPTEISVMKSHNANNTQVTLSDESFEAPTEKGIYYYTLSATWLKDITRRVSEGSSTYTFAIEVI